ncbi:aldehyde ferredoxin oxidoreductase family protein [Thermodesulfobacteriota bacterium]
MEEFYGYTGKILRVDLSNEKISDEKLDEKTAREYIGGTGLGAKVLYDEVPAGVEWNDDGNHLIMGSGPLGGTRLGGSGTFSIVTKGPLSNGAVSTQSNGFFGAFLRLSGYDAIIIQGKANRWVYLHIGDGKVELKDAGQLAGKDTYETCDLIKNDHGLTRKQMSVASIGSAGENLVKYACVMVDQGHAAAHGGVGAVMGSKNLKAVAIARGKSAPVLKDKKRLSAIAKEIYHKKANDPIIRGGLFSWGTLNSIVRSIKAGDGIVPVKNYTTCTYDITPEELEKFGGPYIRKNFKPIPHPCWACQMHHCHMITITEGPYEGMTLEEPEYEQFATWGPLIGQTDVAAAMMLSREVDRLGMDTNEAGWVIGMVMECYEKGILSRNDCDGLEMNWGNVEATRKMLQKIAGREGFGNVLAEGAMRAAQSIGGEAPNFAIGTMKGNTPRGHDHRNRWPILFDTCIAQMSTDEGYTVGGNLRDLGLTTEPKLGGNSSAEDTLEWNVQSKGGSYFEDCLGVCRFTTNSNLNTLAELVEAATGWDLLPIETMVIGRRIVNLLRVFNIRHGHTAEMDAPSPRYGSTPVDGPNKGKGIMAHFNDIKTQYYKRMGWDEEGKPLPETLKKLGLEYTIPELWGT